MTAKTTKPDDKESANLVEPTPVTKPVKTKKPAAKTTKKAKKPTKRKPRAPVVTQEAFEKYFFKLSNKDFIQLTKQWNEDKLKVKIVAQEDYDAWLNYFKGFSAKSIKMLAATGQDILSTEAYAALARWHDIISNPARIDKIHQAGLRDPNKKTDSIVTMAANNDRLGVLKATRDKLADKLEKGAGARDTAALAAQITEVMTQIADYEKRLGPKKETKLGQLLDGMEDIKPRAKDKGARNTSFRSRVTIQDVEG